VADFNWAYSNVDQIRPGGCIRKYSLSQNLNDGLSFSISYVAGCAYKDLPLEGKDTNQRLIIYDETDFLVVAYDKIIENKKLLKDKLVIIGTLEEEADMHITPIGKMPGMKILAYSLTTFMNHKEIVSSGKVNSLIIAFLVCMFCAWGGHIVRKKFTNVTSFMIKFFYLGVTAFIVWMTFIAFVHFDYDMDLLYPLLGMALVEEGRLQYSSLIKLLCKYTKWKFVKKSIYNEK
jgi:hypothetical protein